MDFQYSDRCVAALEILGLEAAIAEHGSDATWFSPIDYLFKGMLPDLEAKKTFLQMSKYSSLICLSAAGTDESFLTICFQVSGISSSLLKLGYPVRGGIALGPVYHDNNHVFGPAFVRATELAHVVAKYPRVVFDSQIPIGDSSETIPTDIDGARYLDVLSFGFVHDYWAGHASYTYEERLPSEDLASDIQMMKKIANHRLQRATDPRTKEQYEWLHKFLDRPRRTSGSALQ